MDLTRSGVFVVSESSQRSTVRWSRVAIDENGPLRAVVTMAGSAPVGSKRLDVDARLHFYAGCDAVKLELTLRNPHRAKHPDGFWELGDPGSLLLQDVELRIGLTPGHSPHIACSEERGRPLRAWPSPFSLVQMSSGGERWQSRTHVTRDDRVVLPARGYVASGGTERASGLRATPLVQVTRGPARLSLAIEQFWENNPLALTADDAAVSVHLFPAQAAAPHELQGGEQKTHVIWLSFSDADAPEALEPLRTPARAVSDPEWTASTGAIPFLTPRTSDPHAAYLALVDSAIDGPDSFFAKRERADEFGWRHFGEVWADHEAVFHQGDQPLVSHYNNQYDAVAGCAIQFLRSGDTRWWTLMDDMARHVIDIDIYHTDEDWAKYNHGLFWHTAHYIDAGRSTHRTYPRAKGSHGGGPSCGHLYTTGLMLHFFLTGSAASRDAVVELATFVIDSDDGRKSVFRWIDRGSTGFATASGSPDYHGPGRAAGNALNALIDAHRVTGEARFLEKAEAVIRRSIHPHEDIATRDLGDLEYKWFYTMFLQSLGKYLAYKRELGQIDRMHAWARAGLLLYANWMLAHERPFFDQREKLEYPTETWPAQDMRKSEVFKWAALESEGATRDRFLERARFFFDYSTTTVVGMATRTLARPVILFLSYGWMQAGFAQLPAAVGVDFTSVDFGQPEVFVTQKRRALKRAKLAVAAGAVGAVALGLWGLLMLI